MQIYTLLGIIAVLFTLVQLIRNVGSTLPLLDLTFVMAGLQWIIGPYIDYVTFATHAKYFMYVSEEVYMSTIVPMYIALIVPYYVLKKQVKINLDIQNLNNIGFALMLIGAASTFLIPFTSGQLRFIFFLMSNTLYVGAIIALFQQHSAYKKWAYTAFLYLAYSSINAGLFHNFILWSMFLFFVLAIKYQLKWQHTVLAFTIGLFCLTIIQSIKHDFRSKLAKSSNPIELFTQLAFESFNKGVENEEDANDLNVRLNQGWIISAMIKHTPKKEPFANGSTIKEAITASLLPRFLNPNKKKAGGRDNFRKYTGLMINDNTSMGMSIVGEAYVNYGKNGGIIFMFLWGLFLTFFWNQLLKFTSHITLVLFFIPLIFLQAVKAETELAVVLNHLIKSSIVVYAFIWYFSSKIKPATSVQ